MQSFKTKTFGESLNGNAPSLPCARHEHVTQTTSPAPFQSTPEFPTLSNQSRATWFLPEKCLPSPKTSSSSSTRSSSGSRNCIVGGQGARGTQNLGHASRSPCSSEQPHCLGGNPPPPPCALPKRWGGQFPHLPLKKAASFIGKGF